MQNTVRSPFGTITFRLANYYMTKPFGKNVSVSSENDYSDFLAELEFILNKDRNTELYDGDVENTTLAGVDEEVE